MERLDESVKEESDGIHNTLGVLENILEFKTESTDTIAKQGLLRWLLKRLKVSLICLFPVHSFHFVMLFTDNLNSVKQFGPVLVFIFDYYVGDRNFSFYWNFDTYFPARI